MKNIHLLPTSEPSRLYYDKLEQSLRFTNDIPMGHNGVEVLVALKNIYITSSEDIIGLENNIWVYNNSRVWLWQNTMALRSDNKPKKIILTTDPKLIADGVQAIDDKFLEWFVKNPSCEEIEVIKEFIWPLELGHWAAHNEYKIMILKEEPKQEEDEIYDISDHDGIGNAVDNLNNEEPKQETIEEAAEKGRPIIFWGGVDFSNPNADKISSASTTTIAKEEQSKKETALEAGEKWVFETNGHKWSNNNDETGDNLLSFLKGVKWQQEQESTSKVTRVEVIQHSEPYNGRAYTNYKAKDVEIQIQDNGKTLKIFLK